VISRSGSSAAETTALSTLAQSVGYLFAAAGPFGLGILHDAAGSWTPSLVLMLAGSILQMLLCFWIAAPERKAQS
jgi:CP family cyanate transporter-like MFS transporter